MIDGLFNWLYALEILKLISDALCKFHKVDSLCEGGEREEEETKRERETVIYRIFEVSGNCLISSRSTYNLTYDRDKRQRGARKRETIAWETIGIARILVDRGNEDEVLLD